MITAILVAVAVQSAAINSQRDAFLSCIEAAAKGAKAQSKPADTIEPYLRQTCAAAETSFKSALVAFDLKNKVARKQAVADAQLQADDFIASTVEQYKRMQVSTERG